MAKNGWDTIHLRRTVADDILVHDLNERNWERSRLILSVTAHPEGWGKEDRSALVAVQCRAIDLENAARRYWDVR